MTEAHGIVKVGFKQVRDAFVANYADDFKVGASIATMHRGEMVVDLWAGYIHQAFYF